MAAKSVPDYPAKMVKIAIEEGDLNVSFFNINICGLNSMLKHL